MNEGITVRVAVVSSWFEVLRQDFNAAITLSTSESYVYSVILETL